MLQLTAARGKVSNDRRSDLERHCVELFNEWLFELKPQEQEIWLWNATVEMLTIKRRRSMRQGS